MDSQQPESKPDNDKSQQPYLNFDGIAVRSIVIGKAGTINIDGISAEQLKQITQDLGMGIPRHMPTEEYLSQRPFGAEDKKVACASAHMLRKVSQANGYPITSTITDQILLKAMANWFHTDGRYKDALIWWELSLAINCDDGEAWYGRGDALLNLEIYGEALASCEEAVRTQYNDWRFVSKLAEAQGKLGLHEEELASYDKVLVLKPDDADSWYNRGIVLRRLERYEQALDSYDKCLAIRPDHSSAWHNRGVTLFKLGRYQDALASYDRGLAIEPNTVDTIVNRGFVLMRLERNGDAAESFGKAIKMKHDCTEAWAGMGFVLENQGMYQQAIESFGSAYYYRYTNVK